MNVTVPTSWSQINRDQLLRISSALLQDRVDLAFLFYALLELKWYKPRDWVKMYRLARIPSTEFHPYVTWLLGDGYLKKWRLSHFKSLVGPDENWNSVTWLEFTVVDSLYCKYCDTREPFVLHSLSAALFRKKGDESKHNSFRPDYCGDSRRDFNIHITDKHFKKVSKFPTAFHDAIFINYSGMRRAIEKEFPRVFSSEDVNQSISSLKGWKPVTVSVSGTKFGNIKETEQSPFKEVLRSLEMNAIELEQLKEDHGRN